MIAIHTMQLLIDKLMACETPQQSFPHPITELRLLETHISWVILTGDYAYKIKKPVNFGFVDYESLDRRNHFCHLELELNRRFAPEIYMGVVPIQEADGLPVFGTENESQSSTHAIDYAVKMHQFPQQAIVASRLSGPEPTSEQVDALGRELARIHGSIEASTEVKTRPARDAEENFPVLHQFLDGDCRMERVNRLEAWTVQQNHQLADRFVQRTAAGKTRCCHGDLHLKNIVQIDHRLIAFDGVEFNEQFQWIDVLADISFTVMDFFARKRRDLGWCLLNSWLEATDEYNSLDLIRYYLVYRALVRAKVTLLNPKNQKPEERRKYEIGDAARDQLAGPWDKYLEAADYFAFQLPASLTITHGFSGSGKSTFAAELIKQEGGLQIRSDVLRHRIAEQYPQTPRYSVEMNNRVYQQLLDYSSAALQAGFPVIADATFLKREQRRSFEELAGSAGVNFRILDCQAPLAELRRRIQNRRNDPSEATVDILEKQMETCDPLTESELRFVRSTHDLD